MNRMKWIKLLCEGAATAAAAHVSAWVALVSIEKAVEICGHAVIVLMLHVFGR